MPSTPRSDDRQPSAMTLDAVSRAYEAHRGAIHAFLLSATRDPLLAEDLLQESFARLVVEWSSSGAPRNVRAWLYRVAGNLVVSQHRRRGSAERWQARQRPMENATSAEDRYLRREQQRQLHHVLEDLPAATRLALLMAAHGYSGSEIAGAIGRSPLATRALLCRARGRLRVQLLEQEFAV